MSCNKLVEVMPPTTSINSGNVYGNDATAIAAITDVYAKISSGSLSGGSILSLNLLPGLSSDELTIYSGSTNNGIHNYYRNSLTSANLSSPDFWFVFYQTIYVTNAAIEELSKSSELTSSIKTQLIGEAKFIRAFCFFYLLNLYGDIPLILSTDYVINSKVKRVAKVEVYNQVISDLKDAKDLLSEQYMNATLLSTTSDRVRPTKWAAMALLARVYLYAGYFAEAESESSTIINNTATFSLTQLKNTFLKSSNEAIWQLQPVNAGWNTEDAKAFILPPSGPDSYIYSVYLSSQLINSIEAGDQRAIEWIRKIAIGGITYFYAYKYKSATYNNPLSEFEMVLRLGEQYLIRAEARVQQNKLNDAKDDLNKIRNRAGLDNTSVNDKTSILSEILRERRIELFTEWGHRWFDLKRTGLINQIMTVVTPVKGGQWDSNWQWYPISREELLNNPNLTQNSGY